MAELTNNQLEYLEWRANPTREGNKTSWASDHGMSLTSLYDWEKKPWFREGLDRRMTELQIEPDRIAAVMEALWKEAKGGDTNAAKTYFAAIEEFRPKRTRVEDTSVADLTDEELEDAWEHGIAALKNGRVLG